MSPERPGRPELLFIDSVFAESHSKVKNEVNKVKSVLEKEGLAPWEQVSKIKYLSSWQRKPIENPSAIDDVEAIIEATGMLELSDEIEISKMGTKDFEVKITMLIQNKKPKKVSKNCLSFAYWFFSDTIPIEWS